jgi:small conductance mechanosensitive channel
VRTTFIGGITDQLQSLTDAFGGGTVTGWQILAAVVVVLLTYPIGRLVVRFTKRGMKKVPGISDELADDVSRLCRWIVCLVGLAVSLSVLGVTVGFISILLAILVITIALMAKPMIENSSAGMLLMTRPSFSVGDQIETSGFRGTVEEIGTRSTVLRTNDGVRVHIPNQQVLGEPILVFGAYDSRKATFDIRVSHDSDLDTQSPL